MTASRIRIGILGLGFGRYGLLPAFRRDPRCEVVALCGTDRERTQHFARALDVPVASTDWQALLARDTVDAVACAVPPHVQPDIVGAAIAAGKPVFAEKPLAVTTAQAQAMQAAAEARGLPNMIDFMFPELHTWQRTRQELAAGTLGTLRHLIIEWKLESHDTSRGIRSWKTAAQGGGALRHFGSHALHHCEWLAGPVKNLSARLFRAPDQPWATNALAAVAIEFTSGAAGVLTLSTAAPFGSGHRIELYGSDGMLRLDNPNPDPVRGFTLTLARRGQPDTVTETEPEETQPGEDSRVAPVARLARRFLDWITTGTPQQPSFANGARVQKLIEDIERADKQKHEKT